VCQPPSMKDRVRHCPVPPIAPHPLASSRPICCAMPSAWMVNTSRRCCSQSRFPRVCRRGAVRLEPEPLQRHGGDAALSRSGVIADMPINLSLSRALIARRTRKKSARAVPNDCSPILCCFRPPLYLHLSVSANSSRPTSMKPTRETWRAQEFGVLRPWPVCLQGGGGAVCRFRSACAASLSSRSLAKAAMAARAPSALPAAR
jgi:hypothetical protein